tara:strand:- start:257 stop:409 length:153 start_codon:yes stop_codon:yes gene_type:complete
MGLKTHHLKPYGAGLGKVTSGGKKGRLLSENVIVRDSKSSGKHQYDKHGM